MASISTVVTECRMESTKLEFALHGLLFNVAQRDGAAMLKSLGQARAAVNAEARKLARLDRALRRRLELAEQP